ncbi:MarR family winged helix-turn-helix transcriptional regulator [Streptomyces sp. NBC_00696]|uniref:MarR family winged helix-turn-helix transcriptional regulator n=1 Tax=Streptomyces sp. NBC_00696 TaxID=2903672 RepID=UPI002E2FD97E|nr:MarR family transcriptional regulator [Streptomyces sp. NBC_00696]
MRDTDMLTRQETQLLHELGRLVHALPRLLEDDMNRAGDLTMTEFAVLLRLSEAPEQRLRMAELAGLMGLTPSRITRVVDSLRTRDLVAKNRDPDNFRGIITTLTTTGLTAMNEAHPHHRASVRRRVLDHLQADDLPGLTAAIRGINAALA